MNLLALMAVLPLTSARSSLVLSRSIFSFQSFDRSFSMQEDSVGGRRRRRRGMSFVHRFIVMRKISL